MLESIEGFARNYQYTISFIGMLCLSVTAWYAAIQHRTRLRVVIDLDFENNGIFSYKGDLTRPPRIILEIINKGGNRAYVSSDACFWSFPPIMWRFFALPMCDQVLEIENCGNIVLNAGSIVIEPFKRVRIPLKPLSSKNENLSHRNFLRFMCVLDCECLYGTVLYKILQKKLWSHQFLGNFVKSCISLFLRTERGETFRVAFSYAYERKFLGRKSVAIWIMRRLMLFLLDNRPLRIALFLVLVFYCGAVGNI